MAEIRIIVTEQFETEQQLGAFVRKVAYDIQAKIIDLMRAPKHGVIYKTKAGRTRQRSAPGEAPGIDSSNLINSISQGLTFPTITSAVLGIPVAYAEFLEQGTDRMEPRPYAGPALKSVTDRLATQGLIRVA